MRKLAGVLLWLAVECLGQATIPAGYFLALKDGTIWMGIVAYWEDAGAAHYMTHDGNRYEVRLSQVDRELTRKLNRLKIPVSSSKQDR